jgi:IclR family acetate operon transcriptional repressor
MKVAACECLVNDGVSRVPVTLFRVLESEAVPPRNSERVQSVDRAFTLLERLADADGPLTLSELAERTDLPMPTIHRLLRFLANQGYVRQEASKRYALGLRMIRFGQSASRGLGSWATPHLASLVEKYGETTNMAMLEGDACVYVAQVPSPRAMRMFTEVGRVVMPHCTGVGKAIMADLDPGDVQALLRRTGMPARTEHTLVTPESMLPALAEARKLGYAVDDGEQELGVRCVAVPLPGLPFLAAISVSGPSSRVTMDDVTRIAPELQAVADDISRNYRSSDTRHPLQPASMNTAS